MKKRMFRRTDRQAERDSVGNEKDEAKWGSGCVSRSSSENERREAGRQQREDCYGRQWHTQWRLPAISQSPLV